MAGICEGRIMKKFIFLLFFAFSLPTWALTPIDVTTWGAVTAASANIIVDCDCTVVVNTDGSKNVTINKVRHLHKVGGQTSCVVVNPSDFFVNMANKPISLYIALTQSGGSLWVTNNNLTWFRVISSPFKMYAETPDPWCLQ
jgi:hypothetical protein